MIPVRYHSSRFPGKVLADINGKPMIWHVYHQALKTPELAEVYIASGDQIVLEACDKYGLKVIRTEGDHKTGTDRIAEAARGLEADLFVNIQGDEPLIEPETISTAIKPLLDDPEIQVTNLMTKITDPVDLANTTVPKVVTNAEGIGVYLSRTPIPYPKARIDISYYRQVCVYGFTPQALELFSRTPRGTIESIEDIEILRLIENGYKVQFIEVNSKSVAVDTEKDLASVISIMNNQKTK